jgi:hypothetical protein
MLTIAANVCAILTFLGALIAWLNFKWNFWSKTKRLEDYLRDSGVHAKSKGKVGQFTSLHLIRHVGLTEDEILQASFASKRIERVVSVDPETSKTNQLLFYYKP